MGRPLLRSVSIMSPCGQPVGNRQVSRRPRHVWLLQGSANSVVCFQRVTNCVAGLFEARLNSCDIMDGVEEHEVVDQSVVTGRGHCDAGILEFARVRFSLVAKRIILRCDDERWG